MLFFAVKKEGQGGIISCIAFSPDSSGMYALGSTQNQVPWFYENMKLQAGMMSEWGNLPSSVPRQI